ncbi:hypothetical protein MRX96_043661 [Rhipicephalus microplus]
MQHCWRHTHALKYAGELTPIRSTCFTQTVFVALLSIPLPLYVSLSLPTLEAQISLSAKPATAPMQEELAGSTHVFFDGCVLQDHSAAAAFVVSELGIKLQYRLN